jgi:hypothetical protein
MQRDISKDIKVKTARNEESCGESEREREVKREENIEIEAENGINTFRQLCRYLDRGIKEI